MQFYSISDKTIIYCCLLNALCSEGKKERNGVESDNDLNCLSNLRDENPESY